MSVIAHLCAAVIIALLPLAAHAAQELVTLTTRPGVSLPVLVMTPKDPPQGTVLLFPGGGGKGFSLDRRNDVKLSNNFLVRSAPLFVDHGFVAAVVSVPSDQSSGMSDEFRTSREHVEDVATVTDLAGTRWPGPIFLVGTSRGTLSVGHLGVALRHDRLRGIVLTASIGVSRQGRRGSGLSLRDVPLEKITLPVLFVHHVQDACWASDFNEAVRLRQRMTLSPRTEFIKVVGGDPPQSDPCEALSTHGFLGKEREVVGVISDWITGKPVPAQIGP